MPSTRSRAAVYCFDCDQATKAPVAVNRVVRYPDGETGQLTTFVHRAGTGCNKGRTSVEVRVGSARDAVRCSLCAHYRVLHDPVECQHCQCRSFVEPV